MSNKDDTNGKIVLGQLINYGEQNQTAYHIPYAKINPGRNIELKIQNKAMIIPEKWWVLIRPQVDKKKIKAKAQL